MRRTLLVLLSVLVIALTSWRLLPYSSPRPHPSKPPLEASTASGPIDARTFLADTSQPWFSPARRSSPPTSSVLPPVAARTDQSRVPEGVNELPPEVLDYLFVAQEVRKTPLPKDHPFYAKHFEMIDLRKAESFAQGHIPYSQNVPYESLRMDLSSGFLSHLEKTCILVVYGERYPFDDVFDALSDAGFGQVYALAGGYSSWSERGFKAETQPPPVPPDPRQPMPPLRTNEPAPTLSAAELHRMMEAGERPLVVFVSPMPRLFEEGHIPGAIHVPVDKVNQYFASYPRDTKIVFYCGCCKGKTEGLSGYAANVLRQNLFTDVHHLEGHLEAWRNAGYAVETDLH